MTTVQPARRVDPLAPPAGLGVDSPTLPTAGAHALRRALAPHMQCLCGHGFAAHQVSESTPSEAGRGCQACEGQCPRWRSRQSERAQMALAVAGELQAIAVAEVPQLVVAPNARCRGRHRRRR